MELSAQDFITNFYSISGFRVQERYKNFNLLFQNIKDENVTESFKKQMAEIKTRSHLEEIFKVEVLIHFRIIDQLFEVIKGEKPHLIKKIIKHKWFFQEAFKEINGEQLVNEIFPFTSYSTRLKLITKMCKFINDEQKAEDYFNAINKKYAITTAVHLLPACSSDFISSKMKEYKINFLPAELLRLFQKDSLIALAYFDDLHKFGYKYKVKLQSFEIVFHYVAATNPKIFLELVDIYDINPKIGGRLTKKVISCDKKAVSKNARKFIKILEPKRTMKTLSAEVNVYYLNLFPKSLKEFPNVFNPDQFVQRREWRGSLYFLLKYLQFSKKGDLLVKSFYEVYKSNIWDYKDLISEALVKLLQPEQRKTCLKVITENVDRFMYCHEINESISLIKEKLHVTSHVGRRINLLTSLVKACSINKDKTALKGVCKYYIKRHKNEGVQTHFCFLREIDTNFGLEKLDDELWAYIKEPLDNIRLIFRQNPEILYALPPLLERYIYYRLSKNLPVDDELHDLLNFGVRCSFVYFEFLKKNVQFEKHCILRCGELIPRLFAEPYSERAYELYTALLINFNNRNIKEKISISTCPTLLPAIKNQLLSEEYYPSRSMVLYYFICKPGEESSKAEILDIFWGRNHKFFEEKVIFWLLRHEPGQIINNIIKIIENVRYCFNFDYRNVLYRRIFKTCKKYSHIDVCKTVIDYCQNVIKNCKEDCNRQHAITILSVLMEGEEFLNFVKSLLPPDTKTDKNEKPNQIHITIAKSLENVSPAFLTSKYLLFLANGDYLKFILSPLYRATYHISEQKLYPIIDELLGRAVSVRKHGIKISSNLCPASYLRTILVKCSETETNSSVRSFLVRETFKFCLHNPSVEMLKLVETNMHFLDMNETETFDVLEKIDLMPEKYLNDFVEITWNTLRQFSEKGKSTNDAQVKFLSRVTKHNIVFLSKEFCEKIIAEKLFVASPPFGSEVQSFACKYLIYCNKINLEERVSFVRNLLKADFENSQDCTNICKFLKLLGEQCLKEKLAILDKFTMIWSGILSSNDAFDYYLHFQYSLICVEIMNDENFIVKLGSNLGKYCDTLVTTYGSVIVYAICETLESFIADLPPPKEDDNAGDIYLLLKALLKNNLTSHSAIIVIHVLFKHYSEDRRIIQTFNEIVDLLLSINDPVVQMSLKYKHRNALKRS